MTASPPRLLAVAHGTAAPLGRRTVQRLVDAIAAHRSGVAVDLCFLDVVEPRLTAALDERPTVVVPLLLSTGYHVQSDIPAAVAAFPRTAVARHLGPDDLLVDALLDRLGAIGADAVVLVGAGSSRTEAGGELNDMGGRLGHRLDRLTPVLTMGDDLPTAFALLERPLHIATYLLAEGTFVDRLTAFADARTTVAPVLGDHPAVVALAWRRYDEAVRALG